MPSHFAAIGLDLPSRATYIELDARLLREADRRLAEVVEEGSYIPVDLGDGAEAWCQLEADGSSRGFVPYFAEGSCVLARLEERVQRPDEGPLDGGFLASMLDAEGRSLYPFVLDVPDFRAFDGLELPADAKVTVVGFAGSLVLHADEDAFRATGSPMSARSFIPTGTFEPGGKPIEPPNAIAYLTGVVIDSASRLNRVSRRAYHSLTVETYGAVLTIVAGLDLIASALPAEGAVIEATCWLTGRPICDREPRSTGTWSVGTK